MAALGERLNFMATLIAEITTLEGYLEEIRTAINIFGSQGHLLLVNVHRFFTYQIDLRRFILDSLRNSIDRI